MADGGKAEKTRVTRPSALLALLLALALALLPGCETLNDALVRRSFQDSGLSRGVDRQIREGLEKRKAQPAGLPPRAAPAFLDQG